jgi:hypothetical protein
MTTTMREIVFVCLDYECGHTFVANLEAVRTLSPSAKPNPAIGLPLSPHVKDRLMQQLQLLD